MAQLLERHISREWLAANVNRSNPTFTRPGRGWARSANRRSTDLRRRPAVDWHFQCLPVPSPARWYRGRLAVWMRAWPAGLGRGGANGTARWRRLPLLLPTRRIFAQSDSQSVDCCWPCYYTDVKRFLCVRACVVRVCWWSKFVHGRRATLLGTWSVRRPVVGASCCMWGLTLNVVGVSYTHLTLPTILRV